MHLPVVGRVLFNICFLPACFRPLKQRAWGMPGLRFQVSASCLLKIARPQSRYQIPPGWVNEVFVKAKADSMFALYRFAALDRLASRHASAGPLPRRCSAKTYQIREPKTVDLLSLWHHPVGTGPPNGRVRFPGNRTSHKPKIKRSLSMTIHSQSGMRLMERAMKKCMNAQDRMQGLLCPVKSRVLTVHSVRRSWCPTRSHIVPAQCM